MNEAICSCGHAMAECNARRGCATAPSGTFVVIGTRADAEQHAGVEFVIAIKP